MRWRRRFWLFQLRQDGCFKLIWIPGETNCLCFVWELSECGGFVISEQISSVVLHQLISLGRGSAYVCLFQWCGGFMISEQISSVFCISWRSLGGEKCLCLFSRGYDYWRWFWFVETNDCGCFISIGVPGEGQLLVSVVGAFEHDAGVVRTASAVGQFAGTSGSISGDRWVNFGAGWSFYGDRWVNLRGRWVRLRGRKLFLCSLLKWRW